MIKDAINLNINYGCTKKKNIILKKKMRRSHHKLSSVNIVEDKKSGEYKLISSYRFKIWLL